MAIYESVIILDSLLAAKEIDALVEEFSGIITSNGGTIRKVDKWGKKRLAFEINKKQYGFYLSIEFESTGNIPSDLESNYNYNDNVLRYLTYSYDKHKLQALEKAAKIEEPVKESAPVVEKETPKEEAVPVVEAEPEVEAAPEVEEKPEPEAEVEVKPETDAEVEETKKTEE